MAGSNRKDRPSLPFMLLGGAISLMGVVLAGLSAFSRYIPNAGEFWESLPIESLLWVFILLAVPYFMISAGICVMLNAVAVMAMRWLRVVVLVISILFALPSATCLFVGAWVLGLVPFSIY